MAVTLIQTDGQVSDTQSAILSPVTNTTLIVDMTFHNTDASSRTLSVWLDDGTNARKILQVDLAANATTTFSNKFVITNGQSVEAQASVTSVIDYWISAAEIT